MEQLPPAEQPRGPIRILSKSEAPAVSEIGQLTCQRRIPSTDICFVYITHNNTVNKNEIHKLPQCRHKCGSVNKTKH